SLLETLPVPPRILQTECSEIHARPFAPLLPVAASLLRGSPEAVPSSLERELQLLFPALSTKSQSRRFSAFSPLDHLVMVFRNLLTIASSSNGVVLLVDDFDLGDASMARALSKLVDVADPPIIVVTAVNSEYGSTFEWMAPPVKLSSLSPSETLHYLQDLGERA